MAEISGDTNADPLSKITLNKYVVAMRNNVVRAKVHTIHKLTRTINTLRKRWGDEEKKKAYNAKADKLGEEILIIKNMNKDNFSKECLGNKEDLSKILADPNVPLSKKAWARVALHNNIVEAVNTFHSMYPDWEKAVPRILNFTKKEKRALLRREKRKMDRLNASKSSEIQTSNGNIFKVEPIIEVNESEQTIQKKTGEKRKKIEKSDDTKTIENEEEDSDSEENNVHSSGNESAEETEPESESESEGKHVYNPENSGESSGEEPEPDIKHVDPFFITKDNKNYLSYVPTEMDGVTSDNEAGDDNNKETSENDSGSSKGINKSGNMGWSGRGNKVGNSGRGAGRGRGGTMGNSGRGDWRGGKIGNSGRGNWRGGKMADSGRGNGRGGSMGRSGGRDWRGGKMGNSGGRDWRGGKMGNSGRGGGRGGNKDDGKVPWSNNVMNAKTKTEVKKTTQDSTVQEEVKLHPSWEAKKKHSSIASFQGKKIKFDD